MGRHQLKWILATINFIQRLNTIVNICWGKKGLHCTLLYCLPVPFLGFTFFVQQMVLHTVLGIFSLSESQESITTQKSFFHIFGILMEPKKVIVQPSLEASFFKGTLCIFHVRSLLNRTLQLLLLLPCVQKLGLSLLPCELSRPLEVLGFKAETAETAAA